MNMNMHYTIPSYSQEELDRTICLKSFYHFLVHMWDTVIAEKYVYNWHIQYICDQLQYLVEDVFVGAPRDYDVIVNVPPGTSKSTISSIMLPAWCWARMPSCRIIGGSYAHALAMDLSRKNRDVIKSEKYKALFPWIKMRDDQDSKEHFINTRGGERYAFGVGGAVFGKHAHIIVVDDPLDPQEAMSEADLKTANHWMSEVLPSRRVDKLVTPTILIMQRLHQYDPTGARLEKADPLKTKNPVPVFHICLPGEIENDFEVRPIELAQMYTKEGAMNLLDTKRLSRLALEELYSNLGEFGYSGQIKQNPVPRGGLMFNVDMIRIDSPPKEFRRMVRYWDKAGTQGGGKYTVGVKMGEDTDGRYWVLDIVRGRWDSFRREQQIENTAIADGPDVTVKMEQEPGSGGLESAQSSIRRLAQRAKILAIADKVGASEGNKEQRAQPLSVQVNAGNVWLATADWNNAFIEEFRYFPKSRFKDQVDAASGAYTELDKPMLVAGGLDVLFS